jgi:hypothetical protein
MVSQNPEFGRQEIFLTLSRAKILKAIFSKFGGKMQKFRG